MKNVYLVGMPGSGKTTLGLLLAEKLGYQWVDTDQEITRRWGETPEDIIEHQGEEAFRVLEKRLMDDLMDTKELVVSTGGGLPLYHDFMSIMNEQGITVYLEVPVEALWERIKRQGGRPLSKTMEDLKRLMGERKSIYEKAQIILPIEGAHQDLVSLLIKELQKV
ncbi:MAG TPA: shikimate kinase [Clostridiaceae bacterium]|nr:shikimate kinase [Clostridiaceae bacterium]